MPLATVGTILLRDLAALRREVEAYADETLLWARPAGAPNSGGALVRHVCGNLRHFVGAQLGGTGYVRDRDAEFGAPPVPRAALLAELAATAADVERALAALPAAAAAAPYPAPVNGRTVRTADLLLHLAVHLGYHLGQLDYHRRLVTGDAGGVNAVAIAELPAMPALPAGAGGDAAPAVAALGGRP